MATAHNINPGWHLTSRRYKPQVLHPEFDSLACQQLGVGPGAEPHHFKLTGVHPDDVQCGSADGARRSENHHPLHSTYNLQDNVEQTPREDDTVHAVEHATMAGDQVSHILDLEFAFEE